MNVREILAPVFQGAEALEHVYSKGTILQVKKDKEKVIVMKCLEKDELDPNKDLGPRYLLRGNDNKMFRLYEFELDPIKDENSVSY